MDLTYARPHSLVRLLEQIQATSPEIRHTVRLESNGEEFVVHLPDTVSAGALAAVQEAVDRHDPLIPSLAETRVRRVVARRAAGQDHYRGLAPLKNVDPAALASQVDILFPAWTVAQRTFLKLLVQAVIALAAGLYAEIDVE